MLGAAAWQPFVVSACRGGDADRAPKFRAVLQALRAEGAMADLDDGPDQLPLADEAVEQALLGNLPGRHFDRVLTHSPLGEYTRHRRHEEVARATLRLWASERLSMRELWLFAYEDGARAYLPRAIPSADLVHELSPEVWRHKYRLVTEQYGFAPDSWEARVTPRSEAFFVLKSPTDARAWLNRSPEP